MLKIGKAITLLKRSIVSSTTMAARIKLIDIGANLTDSMYQGEYHGKKKHEPDLEDVLQRSWDNGLQKMMITGGSLEDAKNALTLAKTDERLYCTVGVHPTRCNEFEQEDNEGADSYFDQLKKLITENPSKVVAIGECGLDYDRTNFCTIDVQKKYFETQLELSEHANLPLFLHCRAAAEDLLEILNRNESKLTKKGVVHSFDGTIEQALAFIEKGYFIGVNGCSLKTEENLAVVKEIPLNRLMIETDAPWCEIRPSHASSKFVRSTFSNYKVAKKPDKWSAQSLVKSRNEPMFLHQVLEVVSAVKEMDVEEVASSVYENTMQMFFNQK